MKLKRLASNKWTLDGILLKDDFDFVTLLQQKSGEIFDYLNKYKSQIEGDSDDASPSVVSEQQEVWASGVTYLRSRDARMEESDSQDVYDKVYEAERPELFFKAQGWRVLGNKGNIRIREDSRWNVPEPELVLALNSYGEIIGYCAGNDVSSRDIEGENPLYLPQAKVYDGSCAISSELVICSDPKDIKITMSIVRNDREIFSGDISTSQMKRKFRELSGYLFKELKFPYGAFLMTGTGLVPEGEFSLQAGDTVAIKVGDACLTNLVI